MKAKQDYLNHFFTKEYEYLYNGPKYLYKYRPFDQFTFDMLQNEYVFLCVASALDDPSECVVTIDIDNYIDVYSKNYNFDIINNIFQFIRNYTSQDIFEEAFDIIKEIHNSSNSYEEFMNAIVINLQDLAGDVDISGAVNHIRDIPLLIENNPKKEDFEKVIKNLVDARKKVGICSFAESSNIEDMWIIYANNYSGYCIEYDMEDYEYNKCLLPVIYENQKETDLIISIVKNILGQTIFTLSKKQIDIERNHILKLLTTKDLKWSYQNEWRLVGDANFKLKAPKIKRIIIGSNADENNKNKMIEDCKMSKIKVEIL